MNDNQQTLFTLTAQVMKKPEERRNLFKAGKRQATRYLLSEIASHFHEMRQVSRIECRSPDADVRQRGKTTIETIDRIEAWIEFQFPRNYRVMTELNRAAIQGTIDSKGVNFIKGDDE